MEATSYAIGAIGLNQFNALRHKAVDSVTTAFYTKHAAEYERFGDRGRKACREDIEFHLDFLRPVLESGSLQPYVEYLCWFSEILRTRNIPHHHVGETINWIGDFFLQNIPGDGEIIANALNSASVQAQKLIEAGKEDEQITNKRPEQEEFETALLLGDRRRALDIFQNLRNAGHSLIDIDVNLIQPVLIDIGLKWQRNEITVAQEHLASATAQTVMADGFSKTTLSPLNGYKIVLACIEGNQHALGLRMIADAFEIEGWEVQYLGANVPTRSLINQVVISKPNLVGLSISFPHQFSAAREAIQLMRQQLGANAPPVIVGGIAINHYKVIAYNLGADGYSQNAYLALDDAIKLCGAHEHHKL